MRDRASTAAAPLGGASAPAGHRLKAVLRTNALLLVLAACGDDRATPPPASTPAPAAPAPWFREEARARGIVFDHRSGAAGGWYLPEITGSGCALFDMDGDGDLDAYLVQADGVDVPREKRTGNRLFRNRGDGTFEDATAGSGAEGRLYGMGVACGDVDGDGDADVFLTGSDGFALLVNDGTGRFEDRTAAAGVACGDWGTSAAFFDYDRDGDLDLYVACYVRWSPATERKCDGARGGRDYCGPKAYAAPAPDHLYRNDGGGRFTDVSEAAGLRAAFGNGLGVATGDFDGDGRPDVFVANDGTDNQLWLQHDGGRFEDVALAWGCAMDRDGTTKAGMGAVAMDADDDADLDLYVVNLVNEGDSFYRNDGGHFTDRTASLGLAAASRPYTRFGVGLVDFDLDGLLDVYVATGRVTRGSAPRTDDPFAEPNHLLRGTPEGRFVEVLPEGGTETPVVTSSRGAAFGDVDGDGDVDVLVANRDGPAHLFVNVAPRHGAWATLRVVERTGADALGADVSGVVGSRRVFRGVRAAYSYCASNDPRVHLGLGGARALADVRVRWVDGTVESFGDVPAEQMRTLRRGTGAASEWVVR